MILQIFRLRSSFRETVEDREVGRIKKETEILYIFFGIHTANAVLMAERLETKEQAKAA